MSELQRATATYTQPTRATAEAIWQLFADVANWSQWNAGVHSSELEGPFTQGSWMTMVLPDQQRLRSQLIQVDQHLGFTDETVLGDITVRVAHIIADLPDGNRAVTYAIEVVGGPAQAVCDQVSADFPDVLRALIAHAEGQAPQ